MKKVIKLTESDLKRIVKRVINEQGTSSIPTGRLVRGNDNYLILDKNSSIGILDGEYYLYDMGNNLGNPLVDYDKSNKVPDGEYRLILIKNIDGFMVQIDEDEFSDNIIVKNENPVGYSWSNLFSKLNKISLNSANDLLSDEDYIFRSLLNGSVPCFEIDKEHGFVLNYSLSTGVVTKITLRLKSKCNENIDYVNLTLDNKESQSAYIVSSSGNYFANIIWDGKNLSFPKSKSNNGELTIKVNESIRKVLRRYFL